VIAPENRVREGERFRGVVINFLPRKGYGFILLDNDVKVFVHYSDIIGKRFRTLTPGEEVESSLTLSTKGPQAVDVVRLDPPPDDEPLPPIDSGRTW